MTGLEFDVFLSPPRTPDRPVPPGANRFVADIDTAFVQQIFDPPQ
jgi:hypothetical protein